MPRHSKNKLSLKKKKDIKKKMPRYPVSPKGVLSIVLLAAEEILLLKYLRYVYVYEITLLTTSLLLLNCLHQKSCQLMSFK